MEACRRCVSILSAAARFPRTFTPVTPLGCVVRYTQPRHEETAEMVASFQGAFR